MNKRRIGQGYTGLGSALIMLGIRYDSENGREFAENVSRIMRDTAYMASVDLAKEKGAFPLFDADKYLKEGTFASRLPEHIKADIRKYGIRNSHLLSLAPTGTISLTFGNNCSGGIEPVFAFRQERKIKQGDGSQVTIDLEDYAYALYREQGGDVNKLPDYFVSTLQLKAKDHLNMLKVVAPFVDAAISKTVNVSEDYPFDDFRELYIEAHAAGLKGLTTYRPNNEVGSVIVDADAKAKIHVQDLDMSDPDRRLKLAALPNTVMNSLRWKSRPVFPDGNPSYTYRVESPHGDFAVMLGHMVNGETHAFEVWVNGTECPRGLGAIAKTLSSDMWTEDKSWVDAKLESLVKTTGDDGFDMDMPPTGETIRVPSLVSGFAQVVRYHLSKIGVQNGEGSSHVTDAALFRKEPKSGSSGGMSWHHDIKNCATGDDFVMFVKELEMPDGSVRPYSVWLAGQYPRVLDGLCKLLSFDMRVVDPGWIGMKLRKLLSYKEPQGDFFARIPGSDKSKNYPSTVAYMAEMLIHRFNMLGILKPDGHPIKVMGVMNVEEAHASKNVQIHIGGKTCPECGVKAVIKYNGCDKCTNCGAEGSCG